MQKILVSACLLGEKVRYDGTNKLLNHPTIIQWQEEKRIVALCPEVSGGLSVARPPAEIQAKGIILTNTGRDVTEQFHKGAQKALSLCKQHNIQHALLKARSPSCGNEEVYNGEFNGRSIAGSGVTAGLLQKHGIKVFNENQIEKLVTTIETHY